MRVVLGFEAGDVEEVAAAREPQLRQQARRRERPRRDPVGDHRGGRTVPGEVMVVDHPGVGHQRVGQGAGEPLGEGVDGASERSPLGPPLLDAVHVEGDGYAAAGEQRQEEGVGLDHERGGEAAGAGVEQQRRVWLGVSRLLRRQGEDDLPR